MKTKINLLLITIILLVLNSCTVQKRLYNKGYNVEWRYSVNQNKKSASPSISKLEVQNDEKEEIKSDHDSLHTILPTTLFNTEVDRIISDDKEVKQVSIKKVYETKSQSNKFKVKNRLKNDLTSLENKSTDEEPKYKKVKAKHWKILVWINFITGVLIAILLVPLSLNFLLPVCFFLLLAFVSNYNCKKVWRYNDVKAQNPKNRSVVIIFTVSVFFSYIRINLLSIISTIYFYYFDMLFIFCIFNNLYKKCKKV